jgi:hypothetical protein
LPPSTATNGRRGWERRAARTSTSRLSSRPAADGRLAGGPTTARAAQVLNACLSASAGLYGSNVAQMVPRDGRLAGYGLSSVIAESLVRGRRWR